MKKTFNYILILIFMATSAISCSSDDHDSVSDPYVKLGMRTGSTDKELEPDYKLSFDRGGKKGLAYYIKTNYPSWEVVAEYTTPSDSDWIKIWPNVGAADGRFYIEGVTNRSLNSRTANIHVKHKGESVISFPVEQAEGVPAIWLSNNSVSVDDKERDFFITVYTNTNAGWIATSDSEWLTVTEDMDATLKMHALANDTEVKREGFVVITSMVDPKITAQFKVTQSAPEKK